MSPLNFEDLLSDPNPKLVIPQFSGDESVRECAHAYLECGWWVVPVSKGTKNPGSILGKSWHQKSSNSHAQIDQWFAMYPERGIALHMGKSGAIAIDVDDESA